MALAEPCPLLHLQFQSCNSPCSSPMISWKAMAPWMGIARSPLRGHLPTLSLLHPGDVSVPPDSVVTPGLLPRQALVTFSHLIQASLQLPRPLGTSAAPGAEPGPGFSQGCSSWWKSCRQVARAWRRSSSALGLFLQSLPREMFARLLSWLGCIVWVLLFLFFKGFWVLRLFFSKLISLMGRSYRFPASCIYEQLRTSSDNGKSWVTSVSRAA